MDKLPKLLYFLFPVALPCPDSHPYALGRGRHCCRFFSRRVEPGDPELDGRDLIFEDPEDYCDEYITPFYKDTRQRVNRNDWKISMKYKILFIFFSNLNIVIFFAVNSRASCPWSYPYAFNDGETCCK